MFGTFSLNTSAGKTNVPFNESNNPLTTTHERKYNLASQPRSSPWEPIKSPLKITTFLTNLYGNCFLTFISSFIIQVCISVLYISYNWYLDLKDNLNQVWFFFWSGDCFTDGFVQQEAHNGYFELLIAIDAECLHP